MQNFRKIGQILADINELIVFKHSIFAMPFIFVAMILASKIDIGSMWFGFRLLILGAICAVSARNFAMAMNRYLDKDIDAPNPRCANRPSVDGRIGKINMIAFIVLNAVIFVLVAYFINHLAFILSLPILAVLGVYSLFKRFSSLTHIVLGFCDGLSVIAGVVAISEDITLWSLLLCLGVTFWVAGFDVLYSMQDMQYDKNAGLYSIPAIYGENSALFISAFFHFLAVIFWALFAMSVNLGFVAFIGILVCALILWQEHRIVRKDFSKINRAFFTLNGYLGIAFLMFVWADLWLM